MKKTYGDREPGVKKNYISPSISITAATALCLLILRCAPSGKLKEGSEAWKYLNPGQRADTTQVLDFPLHKPEKYELKYYASAG